MSARIDLKALLGSRICHDLISPLGAIGNGVELLTLTMPGAAQEIALISESVDNANARIRFFRVAYGAASAAQAMSRSEIVSILSDLGRGARLTVDWTLPDDVSRPLAKLAFLAIQCIESALPWGGRITVSAEGRAWRVQGQADRLKTDEHLWRAISDPTAEFDVSSADIQFALLADQAGRIERTIGTLIETNRIAISF